MCNGHKMSNYDEWYLRNDSYTFSSKGGEIMHIRSFLLKGFIMGAALFFPTDAFAEKSEQAQKPSTQNGHAMEVVEAVKDLDSTSNPSPQAKPEIQVPDRASEK